MKKIFNYFSIIALLGIVQVNAQSIRVTDPYGDIDNDGIRNIDDADNDNDGILDCIENGITGDMTDLFSINSDAVQVYDDPTGVESSLPYQVQLTKALNNQHGQIWSLGKIDFSKSFTLTYQAYLGTKTTNGADGIAAVFHNDPNGTSAFGADGQGLGAMGIQNGIAMELDTWYNENFNDITDDHGTIWKTALGSGAGMMSSPISLGELEDGKWHNVVIRWNLATLMLSYTVETGNPVVVTPAGSFTFTSLNDLKNNYFGGTLQVYYGYTASTGAANNDQRIKFTDLCSDFPALLDTDGDGIPDYLDLDSDGDGCPDSIEGADNVIASQINSAGKITSAVNSSGVPVIVNPGGIADVDGKIGQGIGQSKIASTTAGCACNKPGVTGAALSTNMGITSLGRAGAADAAQWPMVRKGGWLALESKTKGFVINRIATSAEVDALVNPQQGMLVFDVEANCLKMYVYNEAANPAAGGYWKCITYQACPDRLIN